jgi:hypothetical protein
MSAPIEQVRMLVTHLEEFDHRSGLADLTFRQAAGKLDP